MKGNLPSTELQVVQLVFHFAGNEKQPDVQLYYLCSGQVIWLDGQELKENNWKVDYGLEKEECGNISQNGSEFVKIFVYAYQSTTSAEEDFNNQANRVTCSMGISRPLSPTTPVIQWAHEQNSHGGR